MQQLDFFKQLLRTAKQFSKILIQFAVKCSDSWRSSLIIICAVYLEPPLMFVLGFLLICLRIPPNGLDCSTLPLISLKLTTIFFTQANDLYLIWWILPGLECQVLHSNVSRFGSSVIPRDTTSFLPFFGTDIGLCSVIKPQVLVNFSPFMLNWINLHIESISQKRFKLRNFSNLT